MTDLREEDFFDREAYSKAQSQVEADLKQAYDNLTSVQDRCSAILKDYRGARRALEKCVQTFLCGVGVEGESPSAQGLVKALLEIAVERGRQDVKWGELGDNDFALPDGTGEVWKTHADNARDACEKAAKAGTLTWRHILIEEVMEALAEDDPEKLHKELTQSAAVCAKWMEAIHRRSKEPVA